MIENIPPIVQNMIQVLTDPSQDRFHKDNVATSLENMSRLALTAVDLHRKRAAKDDETRRRNQARRNRA